jgi:hypothetical protein
MRDKVDYDQAIRIHKIILGPLALVLSPIFFAMIVIGGIKAYGTPGQLSVMEWVFAVAICALGIFLGYRACRSGLGWFGGKKKRKPEL